MTGQLALMIDEVSTLCHCTSCEAIRQEIRRGLMEFPLEAKERTIAIWLNTKLGEMRRKCTYVREDEL